MKNSEFIRRLIERRDALCAKHDALLAAGDRFAADDLLADVKFAIAQANEALMGRC